MENVETRQNYNAIDLGKFICAILVVAIHMPVLGFRDGVGVPGYINYGIENYLARIAVPFFFIASGYLLFQNLSIKPLSINKVKQYCFRIFRLYIIWSIIYLPIEIEKRIGNGMGIGQNILNYIQTFLVTGTYGHLWYLNATLFAVILITYLLYKNVNLKAIILIAFGLYFIGLFAITWFGFIAPLQESVPAIWTVLKGIEKVIITTRDGLFFGFFFVSGGVYLAVSKYRISQKKALLGFILSMVFLFIEAFLLKYFDMVRERDMYLCLVPAALFGFTFVKETKLPDHPVYKSLRIMSSIIFFIHIWVRVIVNTILHMVCEPLLRTCVPFLLTVALSILCSFIIMKLSETKKLAWLKILYRGSVI